MATAAVLGRCPAHCAPSPACGGRYVRAARATALTPAVVWGRGVGTWRGDVAWGRGVGIWRGDVAWGRGVGTPSRAAPEAPRMARPGPEPGLPWTQDPCRLPWTQATGYMYPMTREKHCAIHMVPHATARSPSAALLHTHMLRAVGSSAADIPVVGSESGRPGPSRSGPDQHHALSWHPNTPDRMDTAASVACPAARGEIMHRHLHSRLPPFAPPSHLSREDLATSWLQRHSRRR